MCVFTRDRLAAYSYMMQDSTITPGHLHGSSSSSSGSCPGIPSKDREAYNREIRECTRPHNIKTPVVTLAKRLTVMTPKPANVKHVIVTEENRICFSKTLLKVRQKKPLTLCIYIYNTSFSF